MHPQLSGHIQWQITTCYLYLWRLQLLSRSSRSDHASPGPKLQRRYTDMHMQEHAHMYLTTNMHFCAEACVYSVYAKALHVCCALLWLQWDWPSWFWSAWVGCVWCEAAVGWGRSLWPTFPGPPSDWCSWYTQTHPHSEPALCVCVCVCVCVYVWSHVTPKMYNWRDVCFSTQNLTGYMAVMFTCTVQYMCDRTWEKGPLGSQHNFWAMHTIWKRTLWASKWLLKHENVNLLFFKRYINLNIWNYVQNLVECLPLFACTEKRVLPWSGPFSPVLSHNYYL